MPSTAPPKAVANPASQSLGLTLSAGDSALLADLSSAPQTIGSGPRCSVRLEGPGLRPMHCVVTPTAEGPVVRRWAAETLLNDEDFTESLLSAGDRLQIGSLIELSVVDLAEAADDSEAVAYEPIVEAEKGEEAPAVESSESSTVEPATAEPAADDSAAVEDEWFDAGIESIADHLEEIANDPPAAEAPAVDPAIPSHLLQPWVSTSAESELAPPIGKRDTASVIVPVNPFNEVSAKSEVADAPTADSEEAATEEQSEPETDSASVDWAVPTPREEVTADEPTEAPPSDAADTWAAEFAAELSDDPLDAFVASADEGFDDTGESTQAIGSDESFEAVDESTPGAGFEQVDPLGEAAQDIEEDENSVVESAIAAELSKTDEAFRAATAQVAKLRDRLRSNRQRVAGLVAALKQRREEIATLELAVGERDQLISELQGHLQDALEVGEAARAELSQWQEAADAAAEQEPTVEEVVAALNPQIEEELAAAEAEAEQIAADIAATAPTDPGVESVEAFYAPPSEEPPTQPSLAATAEVEEASASHESLWGIEQLAQTEQPAAADAAPLWNAPAETAESIETLTEAAEAAEACEPSPPAVKAPVAEQEEPAMPAAMESVEEVESESVVDRAPTQDDSPTETEIAEADQEPVEEERVEISELIAKAAAKTAFDPLAKTEEEKSHEAPASFIEQYAHTLPEDDEPVEAPAPIESIAEPALETAPEAAADGEEDDSIDDYMRKLMERVRGDSSPPAPPPAKASVSATPKSTPAAAKDQSVAEPEPATAATTPIKCLSEMKRGPVRQVNTDMGALRQLANQSARHALDVAATRDNREQATLRLVGSAVALGCGLLAVITASELFGIQMVGGIVAAVGGAWFGSKTLQSCQLASHVEEVAAVANSQPQD